MRSISRRGFLRGLSAMSSVAAWGALPGLRMSDALASTGNGTKLLLINLNGGFDSLAMLQPSSGGAYSAIQSLRPTIARDPATLLSADSRFGFHPSLAAMKSLYDAGTLHAVLNVGYDNMSRSHLDAEVAYARGVSDRLSPSASGYINRLGAQYNWSSLQAISVSGSDRAFEGGDYRGVQVNGLSSFSFRTDNTVGGSESTHRRDTIYALSQAGTPEAGKEAQGTIIENLDIVSNTVDVVTSARASATHSPAYPNTRLGRALKDIDIVFSSAGIDAQVGYVRAGGYDTHSNQNAVLTALLDEFNGALSAFVANMQAKNLWNRLIVLVYSEFGRTNAENGSEGTDHGGALHAYLLGGTVVGGITGEIVPVNLTTAGWLSMDVNIVSLYRAITQRMGYDPDSIFEVPSGATLGSIFT